MLIHFVFITTMRVVLLITCFYKCGSQGTEMPGNLPEFRQQSWPEQAGWVCTTWL